MTLSNQKRSLEVRQDRWAMKAPFRITGHVFTHIDTVTVTLREGAFEGRGECASVYYLVASPTEIVAQIEAIRGELENGATRQELQTLLPLGSARNAVDCAMWELESAISGKPVWQLAGLDVPKPLVTTFTIGADAPEVMADLARTYSDALALKLKLTGEAADAERVRAVRKARPEAWIGVDANQGYTRKGLEEIMPVFVETRIALIEQPLAREDDASLAGLNAPIPIAADESAQGLEDVTRLAPLVDCINIKLDKSGGLTEALAMAREAERLGLKIMVGNMMGTSLATAPAYLVGQLCSTVDLDGPFLLGEDRAQAVQYAHGKIICPAEVWGSSTHNPNNQEHSS